MKKSEFDKILKEKRPKNIIYMHVNNEITLTNKQLDKIIKLDKEKK